MDDGFLILPQDEATAPLIAKLHALGMSAIPEAAGSAQVRVSVSQNAAAQELARSLVADGAIPAAGCAVVQVEGSDAVTVQVGVAGHRQSTSSIDLCDSLSALVEETMQEMLQLWMNRQFTECYELVQPGWLSVDQWRAFAAGVVPSIDQFADTVVQGCGNRFSSHSVGMSQRQRRYYLSARWAPCTSNTPRKSSAAGKAGTLNFIPRLTSFYIRPFDARHYATLAPAKALPFARFGSEVELGDRWHLGSCTKAMTATVAAVFVQRGLLGWKQTVGQVLRGPLLGTLVEPMPVRRMFEAISEVTLHQLLTHRSGLSTACPGNSWGHAWSMTEDYTSKPTTRQQRISFLQAVLQNTKSLEVAPGTQFIYSNDNYVFVGAMLEAVDPTRREYEAIMAEELFAPLEVMVIMWIL